MNIFEKKLAQKNNPPLVLKENQVKLKFELQTHQSVCRRIAKETGLPYSKINASIKAIFNPNRIVSNVMSYGKVIIPGVGKFVKKRITARNRAKIYSSVKYKRYVQEKRKNRTKTG